jgi:hypothetical protein
VRSTFLALSLLASSSALVSASALAAEPWSLVNCPPEGEARWRAFEQQVRTATPGSRVYVPKPYPATPRQVIADYLYFYRGRHLELRDPRSLPANETLVLEGILNSTLTYEVLRVENWTSMRCGRDGKRRDFYHLVRVFDAASGVELARVMMDASGLFFTSVNMQEDERSEPPALQRRRLPDPPDAMARVNARFKIHGELPQYVTTFGTIDCYFERPCLAFRQAGKSYVLYQDEIFEIPANGPKLLNGKDVGTPETNPPLLRSLAPDERLISLGGPVWTIAHKADLKALAQPERP